MLDSLLLVSPLSEKHLPEVMEVQHTCFQDIYCEDLSVYDTIINVFPDGAWGVFYENKLIAYIFFHPYPHQKVKALNSGLVLTGKEDSMYLHEIAVLPQYRAHHIPNHLLSEFDRISGLHRMKYQTLVSVQNSMEFWKKKGFSVTRKVDEGGYIDGFLMSKHSTFRSSTYHK